LSSTATASPGRPPLATLRRLEKARRRRLRQRNRARNPAPPPAPFCRAAAAHARHSPRIVGLLAIKRSSPPSPPRTALASIPTHRGEVHHGERRIERRRAM
jgi:hypothetical protein